MSKERRPFPLCADENIPERTIRACELSAMTSTHTLKEDGKAGKRYADESVLRDAASLGRVVVTHDRRDFRRLHNEGQIPHRGIVLCTQDPDPVRLAANIHAALSKRTTIDGELVNVYRPVQEE